MAHRVVRAHLPDAERRDVSIQCSLDAASISGDPALLERLVANLLDNAIVHNRPGGELRVTTAQMDGEARLSVINTGSVVPPGEVDRLFEPFRRLRDRVGHGEGVGLGLSIVRTVADAHGARIDMRAPPDGGLDVEVAFPNER